MIADCGWARRVESKGQVLCRIFQILGTQPAAKPPPLEPAKPKCPCCGQEMTLLLVIPRPPRWMGPSRAPPIHSTSAAARTTATG